jgi:RimJ/RimL family protein N-acetyltransferase
MASDYWVFAAKRNQPDRVLRTNYWPGTFEEPEIAYEILPQFRGNGYATEAAGAVSEAAFATGRERLWATVGTWNAPSFRVLEKNGFHAHHNDFGDRDEFVWMVRNAAKR